MLRRWSELALLCAFSLCVAVPRTAVAGPPVHFKPAAKVRYQQGLTLYRLREYAEAIAEFQAGYAIDPQPEILFAWAQAARQSGDCPGSVVLLQKFLDSHPPAKHVSIVLSLIDECESRSEYVEEPTPPTDSGPADGTGAAAAVVGLAFAAQSAVEQSAADALRMPPGMIDELAGHVDRARAERAVGAVLLSVGLAVTAGGVVRYLLQQRKLKLHARAAP